eukprot:499608-Amphidinium_carterae.1
MNFPRQHENRESSGGIDKYLQSCALVSVVFAGFSYRFGLMLTVLVLGLLVDSYVDMQFFYRGMEVLPYEVTEVDRPEGPSPEDEDDSEQED